jgi:hypothetical protein
MRAPGISGREAGQRTLSGMSWDGPCAESEAGPNGFPSAFSYFFFFYSDFWFNSKNLQIWFKTIQTSFYILLIFNTMF